MTDGERWTRELLLELRAARLTPHAWVRFLARSFERAAEHRHERRREHRQAVALGVAGLAAWGAVVAAGFPVLGAAGAGWWLLVVLMLDWHLGMLERPDGPPLGRIGLPNVLCLLRAGAVPALLALPPAGAAVLLAAAGAADALDGPLARRRGEVTRLGAWLDGAVDSVVLAAAAIAAARAGLLPTWAAGLVAGRYSLPWVLVAAAYFVRAEAPSRAGLVPGRLPGLAVFAGLLLALLDIGEGAAVAAAGAAGGLVTVALSAVLVGVLPVRRRRRRARRRLRPPARP